ncbi:extracellular solute-binding protein [Arthrobacter sp. S2(2024)]|uniref:extracellular solute-binding protein n=1 Tax=Arthrobacter sp. S2(2024) TaxID=3111911 RepID=UPI002FC9E250
MLNSSPKARARVLALGAAALASALVLSGCGRSSDTAAASTVTVDDKPATGTVNFWAGGDDGAKLPQLVKAFEQANPGVTVKVTQIPSDQFDTKLQTAISAGTVPDMVYLYSQTQTTMLSTGAFAPVPAGLVNTADFFPSLEKATLVGAVPHAIPWYAYANVLYYSKDLADKAGLQAPTSWSSFQSFLDGLQKAGATKAIGMDIGYDTYSAQALDSYVRQAGGQLISGDGTKWTINDPKAVEAAGFWGSMFSRGYASPDSPTFVDTVSSFTTHKIGSVVSGPWFPGWLDSANGTGWSAQHLGVAPVPAGPGGSISSLGGGSLAVLKDAKNADAAWKLARWMSTPQAQVQWYGIFGNLPANKSAWNDQSIAGNPLLGPVKTAMDTAALAPAVPTWSQVGTIIGKQLERVARGQASAQTALDEAQRQADAIGTGAGK